MSAVCLQKLPWSSSTIDSSFFKLRSTALDAWEVWWWSGDFSDLVLLLSSWWCSDCCCLTLVAKRESTLNGENFLGLEESLAASIIEGTWLLLPILFWTENILKMNIVGSYLFLSQATFWWPDLIWHVAESCLLSDPNYLINNWAKINYFQWYSFYWEKLGKHSL